MSYKDQSWEERVEVLGDPAIQDGLNTVAWDDDRQVELLEVYFVGAPRKGTEYADGDEDLHEMPQVAAQDNRVLLPPIGPETET